MFLHSLPFFFSISPSSLSYLGLKHCLLPLGSRCRDSERSGENEVFSGVEGGSTSPGSSSRPPSTSSSKEPLKVMPAPPPKENAWAKRSAVSTGSNEGDGRAPTSPVSPGGSAPPKFRWALTEWSLQCLNSALEWMNEWVDCSRLSNWCSEFPTALIYFALTVPPFLLAPQVLQMKEDLERVSARHSGISPTPKTSYQGVSIDYLMKKS